MKGHETENYRQIHDRKVKTTTMKKCKKLKNEMTFKSDNLVLYIISLYYYKSL